MNKLYSVQGGDTCHGGQRSRVGKGAVPEEGGGTILNTKALGKIQVTLGVKSYFQTSSVWGYRNIDNKRALGGQGSCS